MTFLRSKAITVWSRKSATGRLVSIPERRAPILNDLHLRSGRWVEAGAAGEVVVSEAFAGANGLAVGSRLGAVLNGRWQRLTVVGVALSPEYVYEIRMGRLAQEERADARGRLEAFSTAPEWPVTRSSKGTTKTYDLKTRILTAENAGDRLEVKLRQGGFMDFVGVLFPDASKERLELARLRFEFPKA